MKLLVPERIVFALLMALISSSVISLVLLILNVGLVGNFLFIWAKNFMVAYVCVVPMILIAGPKVQNLAQWLVKEN